LPAGQDLARRVKIDLWTGLQASDACKGPSDEELVLNVTDKWAREWFQTEVGRNWLESHDLPRKPIYAPDRECNANDPQPVVQFDLSDGQVITTANLDINGSASAEGGFQKWVLDYGQGDNPGAWTVLAESNAPVKNGTLYSWNLNSIPNGIVTLRLTLVGEKTEVEKRVAINLSLPLPATPVPTNTPPPPDTETPTAIIPTDTPIPSETPTEMATP